jgi:acyl dehydratase
MPFNTEYLLSYQFPESRQSYKDRDVILYALGLGVGSRPTDPAHLQFTYEKGLKALPTMGVVLAHPGFWAGIPDLGIDWAKMLHTEQGLTVYKPIPTSGEVIGRSRIADVIDKGEGKGALVYYERDVIDAATGEKVATSRQTLLCRGNGGFGGEERKPRMLPSAPDRAADIVVETKTLPQTALIYRLSGDLNPLHADPAVAAKGGFEAPILHGLATYGIGGLAILEHAAGFDPTRFKSFDTRFTSPVYPGETLKTELWIDGTIVSVRATAVERGKVVMDNGRAEISA